MPRLPLLSLTEKVLLIVIEVRRHEPRVVFAGARLKGAQIGAVGFSALIERDVSQRGRSVFNDIEQVLQDGHIDLASFGRSRLFDISGDYFRWKYLWPRIAAMFDMPTADPIPTPLGVYMADKKPVWEAIVRKHGLQPLAYEQVSSWPFADAILRLTEYDNITSTIKVRCAGFHHCIDTEEMFLKFFNNLRQMQVIP
jgi:hypothetical protein